MSRVGKLPIVLPDKVSVNIEKDNTVIVTGPLGQLKRKVDSDISIKIEDNSILVERPTEQKRHKSLHGLYRALINNMVEGVSKGFSIEQELVGVGYRVTCQGQNLELALGFSHAIIFQLPSEIKCEAKTERGSNPSLKLTSVDKQLVGQIAAKIRAIRPPEPYKGKGIRYRGEVVRRKAGKSAGK
ncbi:MAG: 50S ribosomal protein L6 [Bacteroidales bacterium]|nr:50S ribosomal protein L6 [Bacteroidales bacterium]